MLTERQKECLAFITGYIQKHSGVSPAFTEIQAAMSVKSKSGVTRLLKQLEERGHIRRLHRRARCIEVIHNQERWHYFVWHDETQKFVAWSPLRKASGQG